VHLAHLGFPIAGDDKYGDFALNKAIARQGLKRMFLHACKTVVIHPQTEQRIAFEAPLPAELEQFLARLDTLEG
jgi:23S rRNA pseudouridine955/2504/2580 synthase